MPLGNPCVELVQAGACPTAVKDAGHREDSHTGGLERHRAGLRDANAEAVRNCPWPTTLLLNAGEEARRLGNCQ
eukprot:10626407-Alexandrium_andersonii.AAC.1